jgi:nitroreductase
MKKMGRTGYFIITAFVCLSFTMTSLVFASESEVKLPQPSLKSDVSIEQALASRRSLRTFADTPVTLKELSQLLWAAQGITDPENGFRTAPSGMASYPLTVYVACFDVTGIAPGIYRYEPDGHSLTLITAGDTRESFKKQSGGRPAGGESRGDSADAPAEQPAPAASSKMAAHADASLTAAAVFVITTDTAKSFGSAGYYLEAGHVAQNIVLQCVSLDMGGVTMAGFSADSLTPLLKLTETETPIYVIPVGKK